MGSMREIDESVTADFRNEEVLERRAVCADETRRNGLKVEFERFLEDHSRIYIYGAGIVGKRLYQVVEGLQYAANIAGFIVSGRNLGTPETLYGKRVFELGNIDHKDSCILIAVSEAYQNEILYTLKEAGYYHFFNGYIYSYLCESYIPEYMPLEIPDTIAIDKNELMMMQFHGQDFFRYDLLMALTEQNPGPVNGEREERIIVVDPLFRICDDAAKAAEYLKGAGTKVNMKQDFGASFTAADREWLMKQKDGTEFARMENILKEKKLEWRKAMYAIIWPPAMMLADRMIDEMKETVEVADWQDIVMNQDEFADFVRAVYSTDDVEDWQIHTKLSRMVRKDGCEIRIVKFYLDNPGFRIKRFGHTISGTGVEMKERIRDRHKNEIDQYIKDIIIHTTDNYEQACLVAGIADRYIKRYRKNGAGYRA